MLPPVQRPYACLSIVAHNYIVGLLTGTLQSSRTNLGNCALSE
jgi:hypothetical protein